jgi:molybdenum cofactor guanylyltransferase
MDDAPTRSCAGLLLTGGASRRLGRDKATLPIGTTTLGAHLASLLEAHVAPVIEIGPGVTTLAAVREDPPGSGPLAAVTAGARALGVAGYRGSVIVLACDLPLLTDAVIAMLVEAPGEQSVVPVVEEMAQPLCARWSADDLDIACAIERDGARSMRALLVATTPHLLAEGSWPTGVTPEAFADVFGRAFQTDTES